MDDEIVWRNSKGVVDLTDYDQRAWRGANGPRRQVKKDPVATMQALRAFIEADQDNGNSSAPAERKIPRRTSDEVGRSTLSGELARADVAGFTFVLSSARGSSQLFVKRLDDAADLGSYFRINRVPESTWTRLEDGFGQLLPIHVRVSTADVQVVVGGEANDDDLILRPLRE